jgi:MerR family redox-sensitive transcriptional activator SoxR
MDSEAQELGVGELARYSGVSTATLRFYEHRGLITSRRTTGNQRRFPADTLRRIAFIRASQQVGTPLATIKFYLSLLPEERTPTREDWARASHCYREDLRSQIERLERLSDRLDDCAGCGCLSLDVCSLINLGDSERPAAALAAEPSTRN